MGVPAPRRHWFGGTIPEPLGALGHVETALVFRSDWLTGDTLAFPSSHLRQKVVVKHGLTLYNSEREL